MTAGTDPSGAIGHAAELLGIAVDASPSDVTEAFRRKAMVQHPDRGGSPVRMGEILEARDLLLAQRSSASQHSKAQHSGEQHTGERSRSFFRRRRPWWL